MIAGRDSSFDRPSIAQLEQARAAGIQNWGGYLATRGNVGLASPWDQASFQRVQQVLPSMPLAYCSGWDDPGACAELARAWGVRLVVDVEAHIRDEWEGGDWVDGWIQASGAGLYGNRGVCERHTAPFKIMARYGGYDPGTTWDGDPPSVPHGWQWDGDVYDWGLGVDRVWLDDWFMGGATVEEAPLVREENAVALAVKRPKSGVEDYFLVTPKGALYHAPTGGGSDWTGAHFLPGVWAGMLKGYWGEEEEALWLYGVGWDGGVFHIYFDWTNGWSGPYQLA